MNPPPRRRPSVEAEPHRGAVAAFVSMHKAGLGAVAVLVAAAVGGGLLWQRFGDATRGHADAVLLPGAVEVQGVAEWVKGDVRTQALRNASLDQGLPLDDPELQRRLARAFEMHPWVRQVVGVELRHPARALVRVECREPVAMVSWQNGVLAVDAEGVVLPSADFTDDAAETVGRYPRVEGVQSSPQGTEGSPWGDPVVEEAAALAAVLGPEWSGLGLVEMRPVRERNTRMWELVAASAGRILFGSAPGREISGEPPAAAKLARLKELAVARVADGRLDLSTEASGTAAPRPIPPP